MGKAKKKSQPDREFTVSLSEAECVSRLETLNARKYWGFLSTKVSVVAPNADNTRQFRVRRTFFAIGGRFHTDFSSQPARSNYVTVEVEGTLNELTAVKKTHVILKSRILPVTFIVNGCWFVLFGPALLLMACNFLITGAGLWSLLLSLLPIFASLALGYLMLYQPILLGEEYRLALVNEVSEVLRK